MATAYSQAIKARYEDSMRLVDSYGEEPYTAIRPEGFDLWLVVKGEQDVAWQNTRQQAMLFATERNATRLQTLRTTPSN